MFDAIQELKTRAEILQRRVTDGDDSSILRLRALPEHRRASLDALRAHVPELQRKHCLAVVSRELGFTSWEQVLAFVRGDATHDGDFGTALNALGCSAYLNVWCKTYDDAREAFRETSGYLLAFKRQFLVVERGYIETLGLDPDDVDWDAIGHDWPRPRDAAARARLFAKLIGDRLAPATS